MLNDSRAAFPNRIRALVVDSDARFLRSACLMLSLLNFRVATCENPASAVKLLSGSLKDADVVFIDALRAAICGFDFRGIVQRDLLTPVIYFFSFDYKVARDVAESLRHTVWAATYVIRKPLDAGELCRLWRIIQWSKILLRRGENTLPWLEWPRGNQALPATVEALLLSSSTFEDQAEEEDDGSDLFKVVRAGRGRKRKLVDRHDGSSSSCGHGSGCGSSGCGRRGSFEIRGRRTRRLAEQMNVTEGQESDDDDVVPRHQQPAQQSRLGVQATDVQSQQHGRSLFIQPVLQMLNMPHNNPMIYTDATSPSNSNVAAFASNTSVPALQPLSVYSAHAPAAGQPPPMYQQQQLVPVARAGRGWRRKLGDRNNGGSSGCGRSGVPDNQNQQHGRSLLMQPVPQMVSMPHNNPMIFGDVPRPSSSNATSRARATSPATWSHHRPPVHQQQQQPVNLYDFGNMVVPPVAAVPTMATTSGHQPPPHFTLNNLHLKDMFAPWRQGSWMGRRRETVPTILSFQQPSAADPFTPMAGGDTTFGASPTGATDAGVYRNAAVKHFQSPNLGAQPEPSDSFDDVLRAMMEMNDTFQRSYYANCYPEALMSPTIDKLAAMQAALDNGNCSNNNAGSFLVTNVNGGNSASFMAPQYLEVPTRNQVELGASDIYGSLVETPGPSALFNDNGDMAAMFPSNQYDENAMLSLDALWNFDDDVPMHLEGQQVAPADSTTAANVTGIMSNGGQNGGLGLNWNMGVAADDRLDMLKEYLVDHNGSDVLVPQDKSNAHQ